jgi:hypothetical protein
MVVVTFLKPTSVFPPTKHFNVCGGKDRKMPSGRRLIDCNGLQNVDSRVADEISQNIYFVFCEIYSFLLVIHIRPSAKFSEISRKVIHILKDTNFCKEISMKQHLFSSMGKTRTPVILVVIKIHMDSNRLLDRILILVTINGSG